MKCINGASPPWVHNSRLSNLLIVQKHSYRKEVIPVKYAKPEVTVLGNAAVLIEGVKQEIGDDANSPRLAFDCEED